MQSIIVYMMNSPEKIYTFSELESNVKPVASIEEALVVLVILGRLQEITPSASVDGQVLDKAYKITSYGITEYKKTISREKARKKRSKERKKRKPDYSEILPAVEVYDQNGVLRYTVPSETRKERRKAMLGTCLCAVLVIVVGVIVIVIISL